MGQYMIVNEFEIPERVILIMHKLEIAKRK